MPSQEWTQLTGSEMWDSKGLKNTLVYIVCKIVLLLKSNFEGLFLWSRAASWINILTQKGWSLFGFVFMCKKGINAFWHLVVCALYIYYTFSKGIHHNKELFIH